MSGRGSQYDVLEHSRRAAVTTAANVLEGIAKGKELRRRFNARFAFEEVQSGDEKSDFLFDVLRLNATYLNEMARLGQSYGGIAQRALERLYSLASPGVSRATTQGVLFTAGIAEQTFVVQNDVDPAAAVSFEWPAIRRGDSEDLASPFACVDLEEPRVDEETRRCSVRTKLEFGVSTPFCLVLREKEPFSGWKYETSLTIRLRSPDGKVRQRSIPVVVDMRRSEP
jgi:hypothetical protein